MDLSIVNSLTETVTRTITSNFWSVLYAVLTMGSFYFLFEESKEEGWKRFIPIYGTYIAFKLFYKKSLFWLNIVCVITMVISFLALLGISGAMSEMGAADGTYSFALIVSLLVFVVTLLIVIIISIGFDVSISHKFGKKRLFTFGMIFLQPLFLFALAFENRKKLSASK